MHEIISARGNLPVKLYVCITSVLYMERDNILDIAFQKPISLQLLKKKCGGRIGFPIK